MVVDAETLCIAAAGFRAIGFPRVRVVVNDRTTFDELGLSKGDIIAIDKLAKIGEDGVIRELVHGGHNEIGARDLLKRLQDAPPPPRLRDVLTASQDLGIDAETLVYDPTLARGLEYYTSTILEVTSPDYVSGSLGGGGRYDRLIGRFTGRDIPAVGFSFGLERVTDALASIGGLDHIHAAPDAVVIAMGTASLAWAGTVATAIRSAGRTAAVGTEPDRPLGRQLEAATKLHARFAVIVGEDEAGAGTATVRDLATRDQATLPVAEVPARLASR